MKHFIFSQRGELLTAPRRAGGLVLSSLFCGALCLAGCGGSADDEGLLGGLGIRDDIDADAASDSVRRDAGLGRADVEREAAGDPTIVQVGDDCESLGTVGSARTAGTVPTYGDRCFGFDVPSLSTLSIETNVTPPDNYSLDLFPSVAGVAQSGTPYLSEFVYGGLNGFSVPIPAGAYRLFLSHFEGDFTVAVAADPHPTPAPANDPGLDPDAKSHAFGELPIGTSATIGGYVGHEDQADAHRFSLAAPATATLVLNEVFGDSVSAVLYSDDGNGIAAETERLSAPSPEVEAWAESSATHDYDLPAGDYFVRVEGGPANYTLRIGIGAPVAPPT